MRVKKYAIACRGALLGFSLASSASFPVSNPNLGLPDLMFGTNGIAVGPAVPGVFQAYGGAISEATDGTHYRLDILCYGTGPSDCPAEGNPPSYSVVVVHLAPDRSELGRVTVDDPTVHFTHGDINGLPPTSLEVDDVNGIAYVAGFTCEHGCMAEVAAFWLSDGSLKWLSEPLPTTGDRAPKIGDIKLDSNGGLYVYGTDNKAGEGPAGFAQVGSFVAKLKAEGGTLNPDWNASGAIPGYLGFVLGFSRGFEQPSGNERPGGISFGAGGTIYVAGSSALPFIFMDDFRFEAVTRFTSAGVLDASFEQRVAVGIDPEPEGEFGIAAVEGEDGSIALAYGVKHAETQTFHILKFDSSGEPLPGTSRNGSTYSAPADSGFSIDEPWSKVALLSTGEFRISGISGASAAETAIIGDSSLVSAAPNFGVADKDPSDFGFAPVTGATPSIAQVSECVTSDPASFSSVAPVSIVGGSYSIGCTGEYTHADGILHPGQSIQLLAPAPPSGTTEVLLTVGNTVAKWDVSSATPQSSGGAFTWELPVLSLLLLGAGQKRRKLLPS